METQGLISKIQRYSTKDGPGIRSTVFLVGCNLNCMWCSNPELISSKQQLLYNSNLCKACGVCTKVGANGSIRLENNACKIDRLKCTNIIECAECCPYGAYDIVGDYITAGDLTGKLLRDKVFYDESGGGVTFSGGEPCLQADFVHETARGLRKEGVHVALDTAGMVAWEVLEKVLEEVDLVLYDIKAYDQNLHRDSTGDGNEVILDNLQKIASLGKSIIIRLVLVPGINDSPDDINSRLLFASKLGGAVKHVDILPYHRLGLGKYKHLDMDYPIEDVAVCTQEFAQAVKNKAEGLGFISSIGG